MSEIVEIARGWIGTPYRHQGSRKGVGCDCLGLIRGIWRERYGEEPEAPGAYGMDWAERSGEERLYRAALRHFGDPVSPTEMAAGDLLLFRWQEGAAAKHLGVLSAPGTFIHAYEQVGVIESALVPSWRRRVVGVWKWPDEVSVQRFSVPRHKGEYPECDEIGDRYKGQNSPPT